MSLIVILLLLLGLYSREADSLSLDGNNRNYLARLTASGPSCTSFTTAGSPVSLENIIRAILNGNWDRVELVYQMADEACTLQMKHDIYEALWLEWQKEKHIYDPLKILDFYDQLNRQPNVSPALLKNIYVTFVIRSTQILSMPLHTDSQNASFPLANSLLQGLARSPSNYTEDILEILFDDVLSMESLLNVAQRLGNFKASITQLTMANLQLLNRIKGDFNSSAFPILLENLRQLSKQEKISREVEQTLRISVSNYFTLETTQKVCLHNTNNDYIYECDSSNIMCTLERNYEIASFRVLRNASDETQFAFQSPYWDNRYLVIDSSISIQSKDTKNVYSKSNIYWWRVVPVRGGMAIFDAATSSSVLCSGNPAQWDYHAYTRHAKDLDAHLSECTWIIEDCSNK
ncbi:uncharacterized protein LOC133840063 [Drosophila sulfurigaster albostrigata]|uniref:uncharacterized protein LOC133840063 n=1 Tax=Drosophila sulfurigaster albostrigata TaxID=89887 RepID=UPI002D21948B|nr:uncharacterized protein LOC133840063 [Drosophila sulfurigaster albostrigata]